MFFPASRLGNPEKRDRSISGRRFALFLPAFVLVIGAESTAHPLIQPQDAPQPPALSNREQRQLDIFGPVVLNASDSIDAKTRTAAATELLAMRREQANAILLLAVRGGDPVIVRSVLMAITSFDEAPSSLLAALLDIVPSADRDMQDVLHSALVKFGEPANAELARRARDTNTPIEQRIRFVQAMGAFRSRDGAGRLMDLLDSTGNETSAFSDAVCDSLTRLSGVSFGRNPAAWRQWWLTAKDLPRERWLEQQLKQEIARIGAMEQEIQAERQRADRLARELVDAYRELFRQPSFTVQQQLQKLPSLLESDLVPLRSFSIGRISILLQDSVPLPLDVQERLLACVNDSDAGIRIEALSKLEEFSHPGLVNVVVQRLAEEQDRRVVMHMLRYLGRRPTEQAVPVLVSQLRDANNGPLAADALWALAANSSVSRLATDELLLSLRTAQEQTPHPSFARLYALLASDDSAAQLVTLLDGDDASLKSAIAAGFARRARTKPLIDRASDATIYPFAVEAMLRGTNDLQRFEDLLKLTPPPAHVESWRASVLRMAGRLPASAWEQADDLIRQLGPNEALLRRQFLDQCAASSNIDDSPNVRSGVMHRLAGLLLSVNEPAESLRLLDNNSNATLQDPTTNELRFEAAVRTGRWDRAAALSADPTRWVRLLERLARAHPAAARQLRDEIVRRYSKELADDLLTRFEAAVQLIPPPEPNTTSTVEATATGGR